MKSTLALLIILLAGCIRPYTYSGGIKVYTVHWNSAVQSLAPQAVTDLNCPPREIEFTLLQRQGKLPVQILTSGCGRRAVYGRPARSLFWSRLDVPAPARVAPVQVNITNNVVLPYH